LKKKISIVGGGSCALILGCELDTQKYDVTIYEGNSALARKFLVAGDGGLNLTHSESEQKFILRYTPHEFLEKAFRNFTNKDFTKWINSIGIETYVGTSGRVFPKKGIKPATVLKAIIKKIEANNVSVLYQQEWKGFSGDKLIFKNSGKTYEVKSDIVIFCLGGASWPVTGSKGDWLNYFSSKGISAKNFEASNCSFTISWPEDFIKKSEGKVLKNVSISCNGKTNLGEVVITKNGIEGSGIYPLSPQIRKQLSEKNKAEIYIDLKPQIAQEKLLQKLSSVGEKKNFSESLKTELNIDNTVLQLLKSHTTKEGFLNINSLTKCIKEFYLTITGTGLVEDAISTVGGISLEEITSHFELKKLPSHYVIGEMLDYDAPTGGYLLQSCFSMSKYLVDILKEGSRRER
jgi:uncharacterized flavoprotein (TIGR03862 family)